MKYSIDPHEIERRLVLAMILEPLAEKEGCTTRTRDLHDKIRLQHLQAAGVNTGKYFFQLAERVNEQQGQPRVYWDLALEALRTSRLNIANTGKFISQGLVAILIDIVLSSILTEGDGIAVCKAVPDILKKSSKDDADCRTKYLTLAWSTSTRAKKRDFTHVSQANNLYEYHEQHRALSQDAGYTSGVIWCEELLNGLPIIQEMYTIALKHIDSGLIASMEACYPIGFQRLEERGHMSAGFAADYVAAVAYLLLRDMENKAIIV